MNTPCLGGTPTELWRALLRLIVFKHQTFHRGTMTNRGFVGLRIDIRSFVGDISKPREVLGCLNPEECEETENDG